MWLKKCTQKPQVKALIIFAVMTLVFSALPNQKIFKKDDLHKLSRRRKAKALRSEIWSRVGLRKKYRLSLKNDMPPRDKDHRDDDTRPEERVVQKDKRCLSLEHIQQLEDFDAWLNEQGIDDDEVPTKEVSPELLVEVFEKEMTYDDIQIIYVVDHWKSLWAQQDHIRRKQKKRDNPDKLHSDVKIAEVNQITCIFTRTTLKMYLMCINGIIKYYRQTGLLRSLILFIRSCVYWERIHDYQLGMESYQQKVNLTAPAYTFQGIKKEKLMTITFEPVVGLIYENSKKEKRVMVIKEILKFCYATLKRVLEKVKKFNMDVKHGYADPNLSDEDADYMDFYEEYIKERLKHQNQMRR
ncbi:hypothetical protein Tco_1509684 [Tanacetum coccineum]